VEYTNEALREAIAQVRAGHAAVMRVAQTIDTQEPLRRRLDAQAALLADAVAELDRILDEAIDELL
jgi:phage shock protein A